MSGNKAGAKKAAATCIRLYGKNYFKRIGRKGGLLGKTGGFYADRALAARAGAIGGRISRRKRRIHGI